MTDHPNPFAVEQRVLFVSRAEPLSEWRPGVIATAGAAEHMRRPTVRNNPSRYATEADSHDAACDGYVYEILPTHSSAVAETVTACVCTHDIADADASGRWRDGQVLTDRRRYQLLWTDSGGRLQVDSASTPLEETDIVTLSFGEDAAAEVDVHDLLRWAAEPGGEE